MPVTVTAHSTAMLIALSTTMLMKVRAKQITWKARQGEIVATHRN